MLALPKGMCAIGALPDGADQQGSGNIMRGWIDPPSRIMFRWVIVRVIINGAVILVMLTRVQARVVVGF